MTFLIQVKALLLVVLVAASPDVVKSFTGSESRSKTVRSKNRSTRPPRRYRSDLSPWLSPQRQPSVAADISPLFASTTSSSTSFSSVKSGTWWDDLPLRRPHERSIFLFYVGIGATLISSWARCMITQVQFETALSLLWTGLILSISFLEAWVKFKAPFLRTHVAVDVGRHVFCALNTAELALSLSLWFGRWLVSPTPSSVRSGLVRLFKSAAILPLIATALLGLEILLVAPKLYRRAKHKIVLQASADDASWLNEKERHALATLADSIRNQPLPTAQWHFVYVIMEAIKVACLGGFVALTWKI